MSINSNLFLEISEVSLCKNFLTEKIACEM